MSLIVAVDNGYAYTKAVSEGKEVMFPSRVLRGKGIGFNNNILVEINGEEFSVGGNGEYSMDLNKFNSSMNKICTFACIGKLMEEKIEEEVHLVVGLPIGYYNKHKEEFKNTILSYGTQRIKVNGNAKTITISSVEVLPQCASILFTDVESFRNVNSLIIDIGGFTVDVSFFKSMQLWKPMTYSNGMFTLYNKLTQFINSTYATTLKPLDAEDILMKNYFTVNGERKEVNAYQKVVEEYVNEVVTNIQTDFSINSIEKIVLTGGGSLSLFDYINKKINHAELHEYSQMANAKAYLNIARLKNFGV
jgi:plasmid segregation protein ParM